MGEDEGSHVLNTVFNSIQSKGTKSKVIYGKATRRLHSVYHVQSRTLIIYELVAARSSTCVDVGSSWKIYFSLILHYRRILNRFWLVWTQYWQVKWLKFDTKYMHRFLFYFLTFWVACAFFFRKGRENVDKTLDFSSVVSDSRPIGLWDSNRECTSLGPHNCAL